MLRKSGPTPEVVSAYESAMTSTERSAEDREFDTTHGARFESWELLGGSGESKHTLEKLSAQ